MKITITIEDSDQGLVVGGCELPTSINGDPAGRSSPSCSGAPVGESGAVPATPAGSLPVEIEAIKAELTALGVERVDSILKSYRPDRIIEVIEATKRRRKKLKNPAGYLLRALSQRWAV